MNQVKQIILKTIEDNCDMNLMVPYQRGLLAELTEQALTKAIVVQLADLLGGSVEVDNEGQAIIYTDVYMNKDKESTNWSLVENIDEYN
jgi:hypothetical protein